MVEEEFGGWAGRTSFEQSDSDNFRMSGFGLSSCHNPSFNGTLPLVLASYYCIIVCNTLQRHDRHQPQTPTSQK